MKKYRIPVASDAAFAIDAAAILIVSAAIALASFQLMFMTIFVPLVIVARTVAIIRLPAEKRMFKPSVEVGFLLLCTVIGAFNDWNTVVNNGVYDYGPPAWFPEYTTISEWMLVYWGMILRFLFTFFRWHRFSPPEDVSNRVPLFGRTYENAWTKIGLQVLILLVTRQCIYRLYEDPIWSWLPFAIALGCYAWWFGLRRYDLKIMGAFIVGGPLVEILYIQAGDLHWYHLGWFGGVPLWIVLWWVLAALLWNDIASRLLRRPVETTASQHV
jgi:hypothetical protein